MFSAAAAVAVSLLPPSPGRTGQSERASRCHRGAEQVTGRGGCSAAWRPARCGRGDLLPVPLLQPAAAGESPGATRPPRGASARSPRGRGHLGQRWGGRRMGRVGAGPRQLRAGPLGDLAGLGARRQGPRRGAGRGGGGKTAELSQSQAPQGKAPTDSSIKLLNF